MRSVRGDDDDNMMMIVGGGDHYHRDQCEDDGIEISFKLTQRLEQRLAVTNFNYVLNETLTHTRKHWVWTVVGFGKR